MHYLKTMDTVIIGIAGGTGSGKSTFTNRLKERFGDDISVLYFDNYYRRRDDIPLEMRRTINYDHPDAFETQMLIGHIRDLKAGREVLCPVYDFTVHNRSDRTILVRPARVVIVEGILVLQNDELRSLLDIKIFVEADADERILRRILRDVKERGRDIEGIARQYLETVKPMHYIYVEPTKALADIVINSGKNDVAFNLIQSRIAQLLKQEE